MKPTTVRIEGFGGLEGLDRVGEIDLVTERTIILFVTSLHRSTGFSARSRPDSGFRINEDDLRFINKPPARI